MRKTIRAVFSDLDGVIRLFPKKRDEQIEKKFNIESGLISRTAFSPSLLDPAITGKITDEAWRQSIADSLAKFIEQSVAKEIVALWTNFSGELDPSTFDLIKSLGEKYKLGVITNATTRLPHDLKALEIESSFPKIFNSSSIGFFKPDQRIFKYALKDFGVEPEESVFIDDSKSHVESAKSLGFKTHHYQTFNGLDEFIRREGLL